MGRRNDKASLSDRFLKALEGIPQTDLKSGLSFDSVLKTCKGLKERIGLTVVGLEMDIKMEGPLDTVMVGKTTCLVIPEKRNNLYIPLK